MVRKVLALDSLTAILHVRWEEILVSTELLHQQDPRLGRMNELVGIVLLQIIILLHPTHHNLSCLIIDYVAFKLPA